jgi:tetratricopeptide (TPR) repeat protein
VPEKPQPPPVAAETPTPPDKGDPRARFDAALDLWRQNQIAEAEHAFKALANDFPDHAGPWTNLGILFARSNRRDQAIGALGKAATLNPQNKVAFNWLGILHREAGNHDRARLSYERALAIDPDYALAHYNLAVLLDAHLKRPADALPHYRDYLRLAKTDDLKVMAWIAEIEAASPPEAAAP